MKWSLNDCMGRRPATKEQASLHEKLLFSAEMRVVLALKTPASQMPMLSKNGCSY